MFTLLFACFVPVLVYAQNPTCTTETRDLNSRDSLHQWLHAVNMRGRQVFYTCPQDGIPNYIFPHTFDVSALPLNVTAVVIGAPLAETSNLITDGYKPFPARKRLAHFSFRNFNLEDEHPRFPLHKLFVYNANHIKTLEFYFVKLLGLTGTDFRGFSQLRRLTINGGILSSISLTTFSALAVMPSGMKMPGFKPTLKVLEILYNNDRKPVLSALDWSFLVPVSRSLQYINLGRNGLIDGGLTCSSPFILTRAKKVVIFEHKLSQLPQSVCSTFGSRNPVEILLNNAAACPVRYTG